MQIQNSARVPDCAYRVMARPDTFPVWESNAPAERHGRAIAGPRTRRLTLRRRNRSNAWSTQGIAHAIPFAAERA